jgi:hypothetical protein
VDSITFPRAGGRTGVTVVRAVTWCET